MADVLTFALDVLIFIVPVAIIALACYGSRVVRLAPNPETWGHLVRNAWVAALCILILPSLIFSPQHRVSFTLHDLTTTFGLCALASLALAGLYGLARSVWRRRREVVRVQQQSVETATADLDP
jgi:hypothetical protein